MSDANIAKIREALDRALKALDNWTPRFAFIDDALIAIHEAIALLPKKEDRNE